MSSFMAALLTSPKVEDAAALAGISATTAWRWHSDPGFQAGFREMQDNVLKDSLARAKACITEALDVLRDVMADSGNPPSSRVAAARAILDNAFRAVEASDILERIEALEFQAKEARSK